ncbi:acetate kinase [Pseudoclavibacter chungangensis]|uniref:Acetate kinase n=1 Tax=Pseudoclavibacter chungangensis TaxID=587635 RepID=A0A7J5BQZ2_9MICO|nr:acetate kinase [Pseudoclavibacter chungangensis]KAB1656732.1 acetate kinase [Pseudoclavibacter chungangensis]NYJ67811.1 acetate kinase [Pseudoclavibacter chungangensis]
MSIALVVNSGSSSLKYQLLDASTGQMLASGLVERIGEERAVTTHRVGDEKFRSEQPILDHGAAFAVMMGSFLTHGPDINAHSPKVVGHRVVHGGRRFVGPTRIDDQVERDIDDLVPLAPLHNPANLAGIRVARAVFADVPHVAVFDTAFHTSLSDASSLYAIDAETARKHRVRKYGAHGTSHKYVAARAAEYLHRPIEDLKLLVLHIGNGASLCAVEGGRSIETSMGMTPLEGLVMGTRSGDLDPAVLFHLSRQAGLGIDELDTFLNRRSGLLGLTGSNDMRDVESRAEDGDQVARGALDIYIHRLRHYIGAYLALLGGADAIIFTAGVGENSQLVRAESLEGMEWLGIEIDPERNAERSDEERRISTDSSKIEVLVIPTNEELEIARQSFEAIGVEA